MNRRGKIIAFSSVAAGITVLVAAGLALRGPILEEWHLLDLARYDFERSKKAAEWFGQHGSVRAMRRLFDVARELALREDAEDMSKNTCNSLVRICEALERIAVNRRGEVVPLLTTILREKPPHPIPGNDVRIGAANFLGRMGPDAHEAIPALREALNDGEDRFRRRVAEALKKIEGTRDEVLR